MDIPKLTHNRELKLNLRKQDFREGLAHNVAKPKFGSFFTDLFAVNGLKYKGTVQSTSFTLTFPKSLSNPSLFYPVIKGEYSEVTDGLKVNIKVTSINWLTRILLIELAFSALFITYLSFKIANDYTDVFVIFSMFLVVLLPITGIELYRMSKGARIALEEIEKDVQRIEKAYNKTYE